MSAETPKRRGRPSLPPGEKKGSNLTFRTRPKTRAFLEAASEKTQRTITEEAEARVENSVTVEQSIFGDIETFRLLVGFAQNIRSIETGLKTRWFEDPTGVARLRMKEALGEAVDFEIALRAPASEDEMHAAGEDIVSVGNEPW